MQKMNVLIEVYLAKHDQIWFKHSFIIKVLKKKKKKPRLTMSYPPAELVQAL